MKIVTVLLLVVGLFLTRFAAEGAPGGETRSRSGPGTGPEGAGALAPVAPALAMPGPTSAVPGENLARTVSQLTGVALSPLLGTGVVGAWTYLDTPSRNRAGLPWYAQPWFWMPALGIVGLAMAKDILGPVTPSALKKPMDVAEVLENKISGLIAAGAFVPLAMGVFGASQPGTSGTGLDVAGAGLAAASQSAWLNVLLTPFALAAFVAVWLLGHVIHALILISPFTTVDTVLKAIRAALLASVVGTSFASPWVGAVWALAIILGALLLAGWSFRLNWLAAVFLFDVLSRRRRWFTPDPSSNRMFLSRAIDDVPSRTYGRLARGGDGRLQFRYRPWLVGEEREILLPSGEYCVGRGWIYADLLKVESGDIRRFGILPPRYKNHEADLTRIYGFEEPRDVGLRAVWQAIKELLGADRLPTPAPR